MLLAKGDLDAALAHLAVAHRKGPHFADALELTGETLLRKGEAAAAVAAFTEADRYAPKWGRNHLRWGEALARLGKAAPARAQWETAAQLGLSAADRARLTALQASPG